MKFLSLVCLLGLFIACAASHKEIILPARDVPDPIEKATVIYIARHAEKSTNHPSDPDLSAAGQARALILKDSLNKISVAAIYTTNYKRTQQTVAPTAGAKGLTPIIYSPTDLNALAAKVLKDNLNQTVLIAGHSNTVLETIEAFNLARPISIVNDSDYNYLFKITMKENKTPVVEVTRYGK